VFSKSWIINPDLQDYTHPLIFGVYPKVEAKPIIKIMEEEKEKKIRHEEFDWVKDREQSRKYWRAWGSWYSWGSPVGLGLFFIEIAACLWMLHLANIIH
jgi:hypothetical protein